MNETEFEERFKHVLDQLNDSFDREDVYLRIANTIENESKEKSDTEKLIKLHSLLVEEKLTNLIRLSLKEFLSPS